MEFIKLKDIPESEPRYQKTMFEALFKNKKSERFFFTIQICRYRAGSER